MTKTSTSWRAISGAAVLAAVAWATKAEAALILSDTFGTSTLNSAAPAAPTAISTNYEVLSTKDATASSIAAGSLKLTMANTSSGFAEVEALIAASPIVLAQTGDYVEVTVDFVPTGVNVLGNSTLNIGLFNSGGAPPVPGTSLNNGQLDDAGIFTTGNAAGWFGYVSRIGRVLGAASQIFTRPAQVGETTAEAQDGLFNNAGGGAFDNPTGTVLQSGGAGATLVNGTSYTLQLRVTYDAGTTFATTSYSLSNVGGPLDSLSGVSGATTTLATAFDAIALGFRGTDSVGPYSLDISSVKVETNVEIVPEPITCTLLGIGLMFVGGRRRVG